MMVKNLVFDVGGVLIGFRWEDMMRDYGMDEETLGRFGREIFEDPLWRELDLENLSFDEVVDLYVQKYPHYAKDIRYLLYHGELMSVPRPMVWQQVKRLKEKGYLIYLLSNYSSVLFQKHTEGASFHRYLDGKIMSYEVHAIKPEAEIYQKLFSRYSLLPEECLFFDDRLDNVQASIGAGMPAVRVTSQEQLLEELEKL